MPKSSVKHVKESTSARSSIADEKAGDDDRIPWKKVVVALTVSVAMLAFGGQTMWDHIADAEAALQRRDPPPGPLTTSPDDIPRGDAANPAAQYRLRGSDHYPLPHRVHTVNLSAHCPRKHSDPMTTDDDEEERDPHNWCIPNPNRFLRIVADDFVPEGTIERLLSLQRGVLRHFGAGGGSGPVNLVEFNLGIVSRQDKFSNFIIAVKRSSTSSGASTASDALEAAGVTGEAIQRYHDVITKIHSFVSERLFCGNATHATCESAVQRDQARRRGRAMLRVASPSFLSEIRSATTAPPKTANDEYWHTHVDREQYGSFAVTTLLYLNSHQSDATAVDVFDGGQFEFTGSVPATVEPRRGRFSMFSSGAENPHFVAPVVDGRRLALTTAFTCSRGPGTFLVDDAAATLYRELLTKFRETEEGAGRRPPLDGDGGAAKVEEEDVPVFLQDLKRILHTST